MSRLTWDNTGERTYELGVKRCVLFVMNDNGTYKHGVAWSGIVSIKENRAGVEETACWADGVKYASLWSGEESEFTIEAYQCPDEFFKCDGMREVIEGLIATRQKRSRFGLCYTTTIGNDVNSSSYGEKVHIIYEAVATPSEREYQSINDSLETVLLSWDVHTYPIEFDDGYETTAHFIVDSRKISYNQYRRLLDVLYGTPTTSSRLPEPEELLELVSIPVLSDSFDNVVVDSDGNAISMI